MLSIYLLIFLISLLIAYLATPLARTLAIRFKIIDYPDGVLELSCQPAPSLGGSAVYLAFTISIGVAIFFVAKTQIRPSKIMGIILGGAIIVGLGLIDDLKTLRPKVKLMGESIAAVILVLSGVKLTLFFLNPYINIFFTILWVVVITTAFNIIDTLDGLSSGVAFIASVTSFFVALQTGNILVAIACAGLAGAILGFLRYNSKPGTILLGDAGSLFLGFIIAAIAIENNYCDLSSNWIAFLSPLLILGVPLYDIVLVTILRYKKGVCVVRGSKDHLVLRLLDLGLSHKQTVLIIYLITFLLGLLALVVINVTTLGGIFIFLVLIIIFLVAKERFKI